MRLFKTLIFKIPVRAISEWPLYPMSRRRMRHRGTVASNSTVLMNELQSMPWDVGAGAAGIANALNVPKEWEREEISPFPTALCRLWPAENKPIKGSIKLPTEFPKPINDKSNPGTVATMRATPNSQREIRRHGAKYHARKSEISPCVISSVWRGSGCHARAYSGLPLYQPIQVCRWLRPGRPAGHSHS